MISTILAAVAGVVDCAEHWDAWTCERATRAIALNADANLDMLLAFPLLGLVVLMAWILTDYDEATTKGKEPPSRGLPTGGKRLSGWIVGGGFF